MEMTSEQRQEQMVLACESTARSSGVTLDERAYKVRTVQVRRGQVERNGAQHGGGPSKRWLGLSLAWLPWLADSATNLEGPTAATDNAPSRQTSRADVVFQFGAYLTHPSSYSASLVSVVCVCVCVVSPDTKSGEPLHSLQRTNLEVTNYYISR